MQTNPIDPVLALNAQAAAQAQAQAQASSGNAVADLDRDDFLLLLVAKLENQDPLSPSEDTEFVAELATFSSLEQLMNANGRLDTIAIGQAQLLNAQTLNLIGREALVEAGGELRVHAGRPETIVYAVPKQAKDVQLTIRDSSGEVVRTLELDPTPRGRIELDWDGLDEKGNPLENGTYSLEVRATDLEGEPMSIALFRSLPIDGVNFADGFISLISGDVEIPLESILEFRAGQPAS